MDQLEDPLASTSFLDLLSSALAAVVMLAVFAGSEAEQERKESSLIRVSQADSDHVNHLLAVVVGEFSWRSDERNDDRAFTVSKFSHADYDCGDPVSSHTALFIPVPDNTVGFESTAYEEFSKRVFEKYGIRITAQPHSGMRPASFQIFTVSDEFRHQPDVVLVYNLCEIDPAHTIFSTARSTTNSVTVTNALTFSRQTRSDGTPNLFEVGHDLHCLGVEPSTINEPVRLLSVAMRPDITPTLGSVE